MSWLLPPVTDPVEIVTHEVLSEVLVESAGSPLRRALVDSGLGEDLSPVSGLETDLKQMIFAVGLRGTEADRETRIERLVLDTLGALSRDGLDPLLVQSMMNRVEFRHREIRGGGGRTRSVSWGGHCAAGSTAQTPSIRCSSSNR